MFLICHLLRCVGLQVAPYVEEHRWDILSKNHPRHLEWGKSGSKHFWLPHLRYHVHGFFHGHMIWKLDRYYISGNPSPTEPTQFTYWHLVCWRKYIEICCCGYSTHLWTWWTVFEMSLVSHMHTCIYACHTCIRLLLDTVDECHVINWAKSTDTFISTSLHCLFMYLSKQCADLSFSQFTHCLIYRYGGIANEDCYNQNL